MYILEAGLAAKKFIDQGHLVPDDVMVELIVNELQPLKGHNWLLDGRCYIYSDLLLHSHIVQFSIFYFITS